MTIQKISLTTVFIAMFFVVVFSVSNFASAQVTGGGGTGCTDCGGGTTGGGTTGGSTGGTTGGSTGGGNSVPAPTCNISTNISVVNSGDQYTISWKGTPSNGTFKVNDYPVQAVGQKTYTFTAANYSRFVFTGQTAGGTCVKEVRVTRRVIEAPRCESFTATPASLPVGGGSVKLAWDTTNATNATLNGQSVAGDGTLNVNVTASKTYTLNLSNSVGQKSCVVAVKVATPAPLSTCDSFTAAPLSIKAGSSSVLSWTTTNATSITISGITGALAVDGSKSVSPAQTTTYTLTAKNVAGVTDICTVKVTVVPPTVVIPTCDEFTAAPVSIVKGNSATLVWKTTNVTNVTISGVTGPLTVDGSKVVTPTVTTTYLLTAKNAAGVTDTCSAKVTVSPVVTPAPTCDSFTASSSSIKKGQSSTLRWMTSNASIVGIDNGIGEKAADGSITVTPLTTTTYNLTAFGTNGRTDTCPETVTVTNVPVDTVPKCDSFTASDTSLPYGGGSVALYWNTSRATQVSIAPTALVGTVAVDGSREVNVTATTEFILTARDADGDIDNSCKVKVIVAPQNNTNISCADNVSFSANPASINEGDSTTLTWNTTGVTRVSIDNGVSPFNPDGSARLDGSAIVSPRSDITYVLTATKGSQTINCPVAVNVNENNGGGGGGGGSSNPSCKLSISDKNISLGERVTIKWDTSRATEVTLKDNHGKTLITTDGRSSSDKKDLYDGEITLRPDEDTTYTLTAERGSRDRDCKVEVDVENAIVVSQIRDQQPLVSGISLTQVPYTGFEAGPFLTFVFYGLLALWALYLAYVLVVRKGGDTLALAAAGTVTSDIIAPSLFTPKSTGTPDFHQTVAPVLSSTAVVGYAAAVATEVADIEKLAHAANVLLSADALAALAAMTDATTVDSVTATVFANAKASYPTEDGWVVLSQERLAALVA